MLDHDDGVTDVPQPQKGLDQLAVVPLMEADRRLVQHVKDPDQTTTYLGRQPYSLRLSTGERPRVAVEAQVIEPDVYQELQPGSYLSQHPVGDEVVALRELQTPRRTSSPRGSTGRRVGICSGPQ